MKLSYVTNILCVYTFAVNHEINAKTLCLAPINYVKLYYLDILEFVITLGSLHMPTTRPE